MAPATGGACGRPSPRPSALAVSPRRIDARFYARASAIFAYVAVPLGLALLVLAYVADTDSVLAYLYMSTEVDAHSAFYRAIPVLRAIFAGLMPRSFSPSRTMSPE